MPRPASPPPWRIYVQLVLVALCWGGTFVAGRVLAQQLPPLPAAVGRFAVAVPLLVIAAWRLEGGLPRLSGRQVLITAILGLTGVCLYNLCFLGALAQLPAGRTALFVALTPLVTALLAAFLAGERLGGRGWTGVGVALAGTVVLVAGSAPLALGNGGPVGQGELLMLGAVLSWALYTLLGRVALQGLSAIAATTYATAWGLVLLALSAAFLATPVAWAALSEEAWAALVYLGAVGTVLAFVWYYEGVAALGAGRAAVFTNLVPVWGVVLAAILLDEPVRASMLAGGGLILLGVWLTGRR